DVADEPTEPARELRAQRDGERPRDVRRREGSQGPDVDDLGAVVPELPHTVDVEGVKGGLGGAVDAGPTTVAFPQAQEVWRVGPEAAKEQVDEGVLVGRSQQRV